MVLLYFKIIYFSFLNYLKLCLSEKKNKTKMCCLSPGLMYEITCSTQKEQHKLNFPMNFGNNGFKMFKSNTECTWLIFCMVSAAVCHHVPTLPESEFRKIFIYKNFFNVSN